MDRLMLVIMLFRRYGSYNTFIMSLCHYKISYYFRVRPQACILLEIILHFVHLLVEQELPILPEHMSSHPVSCICSCSLLCSGYLYLSFQPFTLFVLHYPWLSLQYLQTCSWYSTVNCFNALFVWRSEHKSLNTSMG